MKVRRGGLVLALALLGGLAAGCAPRTSTFPGRLGPVDPAPLVARLATYGGPPDGVRVTGALAVEGRGRVRFGGVVVDGRGLRIDAVAGPFQTTVLALGCRTGSGCRAWVPSRHRVYHDPDDLRGARLGALLLGRVPIEGVPVGAWALADGGTELRLAGLDGREERVVFGPDGADPRALRLAVGGALVAEMQFDRWKPVGGRRFPHRVAVRIPGSDVRYVIEVARVEPTATVNEKLFEFATPPGVVREEVGGDGTWSGSWMWPWWTTSGR